MIFKKKYLLLTILLIIIFQIFLYTNNKQGTSFRYFKWTVEDVSIGKLINISFFTGFFISALLNTTVISYKKNNLDKLKEDNEHQDDEEAIKSKVEMPPQRDIRDAQPTISVNYRVVKNSEEGNISENQNYSSNFDNQDDWNNNASDW